MNIWVLLAANSFAAVCAIAGAILAFHEKEGWGWFLLVAALSSVSGSALLKVGTGI